MMFWPGWIFSGPNLYVRTCAPGGGPGSYTGMFFVAALNADAAPADGTMTSAATTAASMATMNRGRFMLSLAPEGSGVVPVWDTWGDARVVGQRASPPPQRVALLRQFVAVWLQELRIDATVPRMSHARRASLAALLALLVLGAAAGGAHAKTTWLCSPTLKTDPCRPGLDATRLKADGTVLGVDHVHAAKRPRFDCFYVYPTVSDQQTAQATLRIDPEERSIALYQASRYSRDCRVFAPMYRQITLKALSDRSLVTDAAQASAYADVRNAWRDYLKHYNKGRGVVLMGHSQGSFVLRPLVAR